jgi:hypothetical protein
MEHRTGLDSFSVIYAGADGRNVEMVAKNEERAVAGWQPATTKVRTTNFGCDSYLLRFVVFGPRAGGDGGAG